MAAAETVAAGGAADRVFRALADPKRRAILERLSLQPVAASDLKGALGITLAAVVQHLDVLEHSGLIHTDKIGRLRACRLAPEGLALAEDWLRDRRKAWESRLDALGDLLDEVPD